MRFNASHASFSEVEDGWVLALADSADGTGPYHILLSFASKEDDQDRALGLTSIFVAPNWTTARGYGLVERIDVDGEKLTVVGTGEFETVEIAIATDMMASADLKSAVARCNSANLSRPRNA